MSRPDLRRCMARVLSYNAEQVFERATMSLDLPQMVPQVEAMGRIAAERAASLAALVPQLLQSINDVARIPAQELASRIARAGARWPGAKPTDEPINATYPCPAHPDRLNVLAADGSQVYPDRHGLALYYLINIGSIAMQHGTGLVPTTTSTPHLVYEESDLYGESEGLIPSAVIDGERDVAELGELARLAEIYATRDSTLALLDNGLLLWLALQIGEQNRREVDRLVGKYLEHLDRLRSSGAAIAGFVDRPRTGNVLALLHLATLELTQVGEEALRQSPYRGLTDRTLFSLRLGPGERSARFVNASPVNVRFEQAGHAVQFFYLNCGTQASIARVEVPEWVGDSPALLAWVHAGIIEQCRTTQGFPYALARAHELAVVSQSDRQALDEMLSSALVRRGLIPVASRKALTKQWTGGWRRHRL